MSEAKKINQTGTVERGKREGKEREKRGKEKKERKKEKKRGKEKKRKREFLLYKAPWFQSLG